MRKRFFTTVLALGLLLVANPARLEAQEESCGAGSDDQWSSFAHDNGQTSASSISVGDPNGVTLAWTRSLERISNFTNPTVRNNRIYMSTDSEVNVYDLTTGVMSAPRFGSAPYMGSSNRGNTIVANIAALGRDVVFLTGGNFQAITALETNLESSPHIWSNNISTFNSPNGMGQQNRFNTSKVVNITGTDVLFVCTEPAAGTGRIFAFNAATGALYPGWGTNPVVLDAAAKHGPAVNGGKLYVGTAIGGTNLNGSLYQIDAATGAIDWNFEGTGDPTEGWPSGVSVEGDFVYGATRDVDTVGYRYKLDVSGAAPVVVWTGTQGVGLFGTPTIGRSSVYFPLDIPSSGILQVDKASGVVTHNFAASDICGISVSRVPLIVTLSCDAYLFAGDRSGRWWLFNAVTGEAEWYRQWPVVNGGEIVSGTALASHSDGTDYAVVAVRQLNGTVGQISAYKLNSGSRPRLIVYANPDTVLVPLGTGPGNPRHIDDAFMNIGNAPLNISALTITDPLPNGLSSAARNARTVQHMSGNPESINGGEFSYSEVAQMAPSEAPESGHAATRSMAASASMIRTSNVLVGGAAAPIVLAPGESADLDWVYDGTGLGGGRDANDLEFTVDDPDFVYNGSVAATFRVVYQGPCACDCYTDPICDGSISNIQDVVATIDVAFRGHAAIPDPNAGCIHETTDVDCSGVTDVSDVVTVVLVAFRNVDPADVYCVACQ